MLVGNIITTLNLDVRRGETASSIAERIRHNVDHFADDYSDMRINQRSLDNAGAWRAARCVSTAFNPARWNPFVTNLSGFGLYRLRFEDTFPSYYTLLMKTPVAGLGALVEGAAAAGSSSRCRCRPGNSRPCRAPRSGNHLHRFRYAGDDIPDCTVRFTPEAVNWSAAPRRSPVAAHGSPDIPRRRGRVRTRLPLRSAAADSAHPNQS